MQAKYKGKNIKELKTEHEYIVKFTKPEKQYVYNCIALFDLTENKEVHTVINYASQISIKNNWDIDRLEIEN